MFFMSFCDWFGFEIRFAGAWNASFMAVPRFALSVNIYSVSKIKWKFRSTWNTKKCKFEFFVVAQLQAGFDFMSLTDACQHAMNWVMTFNKSEEKQRNPRSRLLMAKRIFLGWNFLAPLTTAAAAAVGALWIFIEAKEIITFFSTLQLSNYSTGSCWSFVARTMKTDFYEVKRFTLNRREWEREWTRDYLRSISSSSAIQTCMRLFTDLVFIRWV